MASTLGLGLDTLQRSLDKAQHEAAESAREMMAQTAINQNQAAIISSLESTVSQLRGEKAEFFDQIRQLKGEISESSDRILSFESQLTTGHDRLRTLEAALSSKTEECSVLQKENASLKAVNAKLLMELKGERNRAVSESVDMAESSSGNKSTHKKKSKTSSSHGDVEADKTVRLEIVALRVEKESLVSQVHTLQSQLESMKESVQEEGNLRVRLEKGAADIDELKQQRIISEDHLLVNAQRIEELNKELQQAHRLREVEKENFVATISNLCTKYENAMADHGTERSNLIAINSALSERIEAGRIDQENQSARMKEKIQSLEIECSRLEKKLAFHEAETTELRVELKELQRERGDRGKSVNIQITKLQESLHKAQEALLVEKSTVRSQETDLSKLEIEKQQLEEELAVANRLRQKAELRVDAEIQRAQLSEKARKETALEVQQLQTDLETKEGRIDSLLSDLNKKYAECSCEILKAENYEQRQKILELESKCTALKESVIEAEDKLAQHAHETEDDKNVHNSLVEAEATIARLRNELDVSNDELLALSEAFELRGQLIQNMEKRSDVVFSDISFLKMDNARKAEKILDLEKSMTKLTEDIGGTSQKLQETNDIVRLKDGEIEELKSQIDSCGKKIEEMERNISKYLIEIEELSATAKEFEELKSRYATLNLEHQDTLMTMEELSQTAAEEIERREKDISDLARKNEESMNLAVDYEKLSIAYETLVHQYSELMDERSQLFVAYTEAKHEINLFKAQMAE